MATTTVHQEYVKQVNSYVLGENQCPFSDPPQRAQDSYSREDFQKKAGIASGEPWCVGFVRYGADEADQIKGTKNILPKTASSQELWRLTPESARSSTPKEGYVAVWQWRDDAGNPTGKGHVGVVARTDPNVPNIFETREGNTKAEGSDDVVRGDSGGIHTRTRKLNSNDKNFVLLGFINPWP